MLSITFILSMLILERHEWHFGASVVGMLSMVIRQTNVIWVLMVAGRYFILEWFDAFVVRRRRPMRAVDLKISLAVRLLL